MPTTASNKSHGGRTKGPSVTATQNGTQQTETHDVVGEEQARLMELFYTEFLPRLAAHSSQTKASSPSDTTHTHAPPPPAYNSQASFSDPTDISRSIKNIESTLGAFSKALTVLPSEKDLPGNEDRQVSKQVGLNFVLTDKYEDKTWAKSVFAFAAAPLTCKLADIPLGTYKDAYSNATSFLKDDAVTHAKSWWDSASGLVSRGSEWISDAASEASKAISSTDSSVLLGLGVAGVAVAAAGYGAYNWYNQHTASEQTKETTKDEGAEPVSSTRETVREGLDKVRSLASQIKVPHVSQRII